MQTIRAVGPVSRALCDAPAGTMIGARGPFGTHWDLDVADGEDVVVVGGGCGLAPLRPIVLAVLAQRARFRRVIGVFGARDPAEFIFAAEISLWTGRSDLELLCTVDRGDPGWSGRVGLVTGPMATVALTPEQTTAYLCGPEVMIRNTAELLIRRGVPAERIQVSVERNMHCGVGLCGHCQLGPLLIRDGEVDDVRLNIYEPPRFFEALLRGRAYTEPPDLTARICGICPVAYQMSSCQAIERACGVRVDGPLADLRRLLYPGSGSPRLCPGRSSADIGVGPGRAMRYRPHRST